jgi:hypothetical protein
MQVRFGTEVEYIAQKYTGVGDLKNHVSNTETYGDRYRRRNEHTHLYIHWIHFLRTGT